MVIRLHFNTIEKSFDYTDYNGAYIFTANYCLSLAAALFMFLLVSSSAPVCFQCVNPF